MASCSDLKIRALRRDDLDEVARIRLRTFRYSSHTEPETMSPYLGEVFLENPWQEGRSTSFVAELPNGRIAAFLGAIPRPFTFRGSTIRGSILSHFMVHEDYRGKGIGSRLLKSWLAGQQDFSWSDIANDATRAAMTKLGAWQPLLHCLYWKVAVRKRTAVVDALKLGLLGRVSRRAMRPVLQLCDNIACKRQPDNFITREATDVEFEHALCSTYRVGLCALYTEATLSFLLAQLRRRPKAGILRSVIVDSIDGVTHGCFIYFAVSGGGGEVVLMAAARGSELVVVNALRADAFSRCCVTLNGRIEPQFLEVMSEEGFVFRQQDPSALIHSRDSDLVVAVATGCCAISRLDGEWWISA